jgi:hypothetical protein
MGPFTRLSPSAGGRSLPRQGSPLDRPLKGRPSIIGLWGQGGSTSSRATTTRGAPRSGSACSSSSTSASGSRSAGLEGGRMRGDGGPRSAQPSLLAPHSTHHLTHHSTHSTHHHSHKSAQKGVAAMKQARPHRQAPPPRPEEHMGPLPRHDGPDSPEAASEEGPPPRHTLTLPLPACPAAPPPRCLQDTPPRLPAHAAAPALLLCPAVCLYGRAALRPGPVGSDRGVVPPLSAPAVPTCRPVPAPGVLAPPRQLPGRRGETRRRRQERGDARRQTRQDQGWSRPDARQDRVAARQDERASRPDKTSARLPRHQARRARPPLVVLLFGVFGGVGAVCGMWVGGRGGGADTAGRRTWGMAWRTCRGRWTSRARTSTASSTAWYPAPCCPSTCAAPPHPLHHRMVAPSMPSRAVEDAVLGGLEGGVGCCTRWPPRGKGAEYRVRGALRRRYAVPSASPMLYAMLYAVRRRYAVPSASPIRYSVPFPRPPRYPPHTHTVAAPLSRPSCSPPLSHMYPRLVSPPLFPPSSLTFDSSDDGPAKERRGGGEMG